MEHICCQITVEAAFWICYELICLHVFSQVAVHWDLQANLQFYAESLQTPIQFHKAQFSLIFFQLISIHHFLSFEAESSDFFLFLHNLLKTFYTYLQNLISSLPEVENKMSFEPWVKHIKGLFLP